jgi:hypothetical protein
VLAELQLRQRLVHQPDRLPQLPAGRGEDHPLHVLVQPAIVDGPWHILPQQVEDTPIGHVALEHGEEDVVAMLA